MFNLTPAGTLWCYNCSPFKRNAILQRQSMLLFCQPITAKTFLHLSRHLNSLRIWFCENGMALNPTKSIAILFGTPKRLKSFSGLKSCNVAGTDI